MSISIVIVTYNSAGKVKRLLDSILLSSLKPREIILVDNNSKDQDKLRKKLSEYSKKKINIIAKFLKTNNGFGTSCNYGSQFNTSDYLLFLNPDTKVNKYSLEILLKHTIKYKADICGGKSLEFITNKIHRTVFNIPNVIIMLYEFSNFGKLLKREANFYLDQGQIHTDLEVSGVGGAYFLIKKLVYKKLSGFDEKFFMYLEDVGLCVRAKQQHFKILYCPHSTIHHVGGASSNNKYKISHKSWYTSRQHYLKKHFKIWDYITITILYCIEKLTLELRKALL